MPHSLAVYIHWPYCVSKCPYCDFNSQAGAWDEDVMRQAYLREIAAYALLLPERTVTSVYFGGGTPSLMSPHTVAALLDAVARGWRIADDAEITLEANPSSAESTKFAGFRAAGINRLSLGIQSLCDDTLRFLGRPHNAAEGMAAIALAAQHFPRYSFDLIYAVRGQSVSGWRQELAQALQLGASHMSLYQLTIENGTRFYDMARQGQALAVDENVAAEMYLVTDEIMTAVGVPAYEVSNYAAHGHESRHNLQYWQYRDYVGIGAGAHGRYVVGASKDAVAWCSESSPPHRGEAGVRGLKNQQPAVFSSSPSPNLPPRGEEPCHFDLNHGFLTISDRKTRVATANHRKPEIWLEAVANQGRGIQQQEELTTNDAMNEALLMGLRLRQGINLRAWQQQFGCDLIGGLVSDATLSSLINGGYLETDGRTYLRTTFSGVMCLDAVIGKCLG